MQEKIICPQCGKEINSKGLKQHSWRRHTERGRQFKPKLGKRAWNRGLTKKTNSSLKNASEKLKNNKTWLGRKHSEETKRKISEHRKKYLAEHPDKVPSVRYNAYI